MSKIQILLGCQVQGCAEEVSYPADMLRLYNDKPICEVCYDDLVPVQYDDEDEELPRAFWDDLQLITLDDLCL